MLLQTVYPFNVGRLDGYISATKNTKQFDH